MLLALATGYEIGARAGEAWRIPAGWHVDGSWHSLGVAAAAARLIGGPERMQAAIEGAACQIPASLYLPITAGSVVRNTYVAHAVLLGLMAAARLGATRILNGLQRDCAIYEQAATEHEIRGFLSGLAKEANQAMIAGRLRAFQRRIWPSGPPRPDGEPATGHESDDD